VRAHVGAQLLEHGGEQEGRRDAVGVERLDAVLVIGIWLGSLLFYMVIIALTWVYPLIINRMVEPAIDFGLLFTGYLGIFLSVSAFLSVGIFVSSLFSNQIAAFFATLIVLLIAWFLSVPTQMAQSNSMFTTIIQYLDLSEHFYNTLAIGLIHLKDVVYFVSFTTFMLFLAAQSVETRRWR
jgi:ABC-2 type transport system permease protein